MNFVETDRFVPLERVYNLRDLGGLVGRDDRKVRSGLVFRSDQFGNATPADVAFLRDQLQVRTVVDLRWAAEIAATGSFPDGDGVTVRHLELQHLSWDRFTARAADETFLFERYTAMIETGYEAIRDTLDLMCDASPMVFHCMAGKDRTGLIAAVALRLLGVDADSVVDDYAQTLHGMNRYWASRGESCPRGYLPKAEAMHGVLRNLDTYYGGAEAYAEIIGFDRADELRERLLT